jgi:hypothetical protein
MTYSDGDVYDGHWLNGKENGKGRMTYSDGDVYDGDWLNGKWHGPGSWNEADGETKEGEFKGWRNSVRHADLDVWRCV